MLAGAARGGMESKGGGGAVRLSDVVTRELEGFQNELIRCFMLAADVVGGGFREFMNNADRPAFLKSELVGLGVDGYLSKPDQTGPSCICMLYLYIL